MFFPLELIIPVALIVVGYLAGRFNERRHYRLIREGEDRYRDLLVHSGRELPPAMIRHQARMVCGSVVISVDFFKVLLAGLRNLVGGRIGAFESLIDRARREAVLRLQANARELNADAVFNLRFETSRISGDLRRGIGSMEVLAYGTALIPRQ
jgi:uncharacterized protein YbjQ (UPF0145 family)